MERSHIEALVTALRSFRAECRASQENAEQAGNGLLADSLHIMRMLAARFETDLQNEAIDWNRAQSLSAGTGARSSGPTASPSSPSSPRESADEKSSTQTHRWPYWPSSTACSA